MSDKPVTVAVIADTHVDQMDELPESLLESLSRVDAVIHLGDYTSPGVLNSLKNLGNFYGVIGNHDSSIGRKELKVMEVVELGGKRLGLIHGVFLPLARPKRIQALFKKYNVDILLIGHNHMIMRKMMNGVFIFNPGTVTGKFPATQATYGILTLDGTIKSEIIPLEFDIPYRDHMWLKVLALIIRLAIRWLEAWPYIDVRPVLNNMKMKR